MRDSADGQGECEAVDPIGSAFNEGGNSVGDNAAFDDNRPMPDVRPRIIFDTSALNALADEPESEAIVKSLGIGFRVRLSETSLAEIGATPRPERREELLALCRH